MKKLLILLFVSSFNIAVNGQSPNYIKANVINETGDTVMGNAMVLSIIDSSIIKAVSFINGEFEIDQIVETEVILKLSSLEFKDKLMPIDFKNDPKALLGNIIVSTKENLLDQVVVKGSLPLVQTMSNGSLQVNVAETILASSTTVQEILSKSPGVMVDENVVTVLGKGAAIIYLNGQRIFNEQLGNIQPSEIKKIEIIGNPSAKYDAEGRAVINIITKSGSFEGIKGQFNQNMTVSDFSPLLNVSNFSLDYSKGKFSFHTNYNLSLGTYRFILNTSRIRRLPNEPFTSTITTDWEREYQYYANQGLGIQYSLGENSYISLSYNGIHNDLGGTETSNNVINFKNDLEQIENIVYKDERTRQNAFVLNYLQEIDTLGSSIFIGTQYARYKNSLNDEIDETINLNGENFLKVIKNDALLQIPILSTQVDYKKVFKSKGSIEAGLKYGNISNGSSSLFSISQNGGEFVKDFDLSRDFAYNEDIYAAYAIYNKALKEGNSVSFGLRNEYTLYNLTYGNRDSDFLENSYFNLFPNFSFQRKITESKSLYFNYSSRIERPRYQSLNPTIIYQDAYTSIQGNPNVVPEKIHSVEMGLNIGQLVLKTGYNFTIDPMTGGAVQGENAKSYILQRLNSEFGHEIFLNSSFSINKGILTSINNVNLSYSRLVDNFNFVLNRTLPQAYLYSNNSFKIADGLKFQVLAWYLSNRYDGIYFRRNQSEINIGVEKELFKKSVKVQLLANDIFHQNKPDGSYQLGETFILFDRVYNTQHFRFVATYNFGKLKKKANRERRVGNEERNRL